MSGKLVGEVVQWLLTPAGADLSQAERVVLFTVAERSNPETREMWRHKADSESLYERIRRVTGMEEKSLGNVFGRLAKRGLDVRVPTGVNKRGQPTFANCGHSTRFRLPVFKAQESTPTKESSIGEWTFDDEEDAAETADPLVDNYDPEPEKVHSPMDLQAESSTDGWTITPERSIDGWTVYPSKNYPSKTNPSSLLAVGEFTSVTRETPRAPSAKKRSSLHPPADAWRLLARLPARYYDAPDWARRHLADHAAAAIAEGYATDAICRYAHMLAIEGDFPPHEHIPEFDAAIRRLARDVRLGDACEHCGLPECDGHAPPADASADEIDPAVLADLYARLGVTPADLAEGIAA